MLQPSPTSVAERPRPIVVLVDAMVSGAGGPDGGGGHEHDVSSWRCWLPDDPRIEHGGTDHEVAARAIR